MRKSLIKTLKSKTSIKGLIVIFVIGVFFAYNPTFAQTNSADTDFFQGMSDIINEIMKFCSRAWIVLAIIAGKFMTNSMVYGARLHLDQYLRQIWNITKNFANFGLLAFMLREIIGFISGKEKNIQKTITKTLIAGILIQASWFIVGAVIDVSTIATSAVGGFASNVIDTSTNKETLRTMVTKNMAYYTIDLTDEKTPKKTERKDITDEDINKILDKIMPSADSVGGPLVVIGASALRAQDMTTMDKATTNELKSIIISLGLNGIMLLLYCVVMLLMIVANVIRVGFLWVVIAISPIIVLFMVFKGPKESFDKNFNLTSIINIIFKPVVFVAMLSMILIFLSSIQRIMTDQSEIQLNGVTFTTPKGGSASMEMGGNIISINDRTLTQVGETSRSIFANLIIYFATLFLLRFLVKVAITSGPGPLKKPMEKMTGWIEQTAKTVPIFQGAGFSAIQGGLSTNRDAILKNIGMNKSGKVNIEQNDIVNEAIASKFGLLNGRTQREHDELEKLATKQDKSFFEKSKEIFGKESDRTIMNAKWQPIFKNRLDNQTDKSLNDLGFGDYDKEKDTIEIFLKKKNKTNDENFKVLNKYLGGGIEINTYDEFIKHKYGKDE